jgi:transposase
MTGKDRPALAAIPLYAHDNLYVGVDIGKKGHVAAFVSRTLLDSHKRYEACPVLRFENNRLGFRALVKRIGEYVPLEQAFVLVEKTGHYHLALRAYLLDLGLAVHEVHVHERSPELTKTDKRDAQGLANQLYNQLELHAQVAEKKQLVRVALPNRPVARELHRLVQHRAELVRETTRRKNKLTSILDQLFPEFTQVLKNPNGETALAIRAAYPTPHAIATATLPALTALRHGGLPSNASLARLQELAAQTIGVHDVVGQRALAFEQSVLIEELLMLQRNIAKREAQIEAVVTTSREGQILTSLPGIGSQIAAVLVAAIGNVLNLPTAGDLKAYLGWSTQQIQTGTTMDRARLSPTGTRSTRALLYMAVCAAIREDNQFANLYQRLVPKKCSYDERKQDYVGRNRVIGTVAGRMICMIYMLLRTDAELLATVPADMEPPAPKLYDPEVHRAHARGGYVPAKQRAKPARIVRLPKNPENS